ncbi:MAG: hypothetical protein ACRD0C_07385, partial [Acidimicrobiia bacterium]
IPGRAGRERGGRRAFRVGGGDALIVPVRDAGVTLCHHNPHDEPARFICAWPDLTPVLGMDLGSGLEQLEPAPGWNGDVENGS